MKAILPNNTRKLLWFEARKDFERKLATDIKFDKKSFFAHAKK